VSSLHGDRPQSPRDETDAVLVVHRMIKPLRSSDANCDESVPLDEEDEEEEEENGSICKIGAECCGNSVAPLSLSPNPRSSSKLLPPPPEEKDEVELNPA
jgi:hypothetical protein